MNEEEKTTEKEMTEAERDRQYKEKCIIEFALTGQIRNITGALVTHLFNLEALNRKDVSMNAIMLNGALTDTRAVSRLLQKLGFAYEDGEFVEKEEETKDERTNVLMSELKVTQLACLQGYWKKLEEKEPPAKATRNREKFTDGYETARKRMQRQNEEKAEKAEKETISQKPTETSVKSRDEREMIRKEYLETLSTEKLTKRLENVRKIIARMEEPDARWLDEREKIEALLTERSGQ